MEDKYDIYLQEMLDSNKVPEDRHDNDDLQMYKDLYRLLANDIPVELPANFSSRVQGKIVAKRERFVTVVYAVLIFCLLSAAAAIFVSVYKNTGAVIVLQLLYAYKWAFLACILLTFFLVTREYQAMKHAMP